MLCISFERFLSKGATRPFLGKCDDNKLYVVKVHGNPLGPKSIYNEYIVGNLAKEIELPWPNVQLIQLSPEITFFLEKNGLKILSEWAVGINYIKGIKEVIWPPNSFYKDPDFAAVNAKYIMKIFPSQSTNDALYGKSVFDNWVLLEDTTYDTLHITSDGLPLFLDASIALGGLEWDDNKLQWKHISFDRSVYLYGFKFEMTRFEPWLKRIERISNSTFESILFNIPEEWAVPDAYLKSMKNFLFSTKDTFLPVIREWIEFEILLIT